MPVASRLAILSFRLAWNDVFDALARRRSNTMTAPVAIVNFVALPVVALSLPMRRYLVSGLTAGGVRA
jgi:multiple sugar transport system permease protein